MTPAELRAAGRLGGHVFAGVVSRIEQVHQAVAGRAFGPIRHAGAPARFIHDHVSRSVYLTVRTAGSAAGALVGEVLSPLGAGGQPASSTPKGNLALSALNAIAGDRLRPDVAPLAIRMAVRAGGRDVDLAAGDVAAAFPDATPGLAVFVHGLAETEPRSRTIPVARSAPWWATSSSGRPARTAGAAVTSASRFPRSRAAGSAEFIISTCSTIPPCGPRCAACSATPRTS